MRIVLLFRGSAKKKGSITGQFGSLATSVKKEKKNQHLKLVSFNFIYHFFKSLSLIFLRQTKKKVIYPLKFMQTIRVKRKGFLRCMFCLSIESKN